jgi:formyltetrahydrofolate deformylase
MIISNHMTAKPMADFHHVPFHLLTNPKDKRESEREMLEDDVEDMVRKGRDLEKVVLSRAVRWHLENRVLVYQNKTVVFA